MIADFLYSEVPNFGRWRDQASASNQSSQSHSQVRARVSFTSACKSSFTSMCKSSQPHSQVRARASSISACNSRVILARSSRSLKASKLARSRSSRAVWRFTCTAPAAFSNSCWTGCLLDSAGIHSSYQSLTSHSDSSRWQLDRSVRARVVSSCIHNTQPSVQACAPRT